MESQAQAPKLLEQVRNVLRLHHYLIHYSDAVAGSGIGATGDGRTPGLRLRRAADNEPPHVGCYELTMRAPLAQPITLDFDQVWLMKTPRGRALLDVLSSGEILKASFDIF